MSSCKAGWVSLWIVCVLHACGSNVVGAPPVGIGPLCLAQLVFFLAVPLGVPGWEGETLTGVLSVVGCSATWTPLQTSALLGFLTLQLYQCRNEPVHG